MNKDVYFIKKTFRLAKRAQGFTSPNPLVGALIVKNNKVISFGYHHRCGLPHAEIEAIRKVEKQSIKGAKLYVNLEPCYHFGRTPPCVDEIIKVGIKEVVIATLDPNPRVNGKSIKKLQKAGIKVKVGVCEEQAVQLNEVFFTNIKKKRSFIVAKIAQSLDGKIATAKGISKWITCQRSRVFAKSLRDKYDAVLVGVNTVIVDNPSLNGSKKRPYKIVIDPNLRIPLKSNLVSKDCRKLIVFASYKSRSRKLPELKNIFFVKEVKGKLDLKEIVKRLYSLGIMSVFVEGGSTTIGRFFDSELVDKAHFFISPKIIGGSAALSSIGGQGVVSPNHCVSLKSIRKRQLDEDILITGYPFYEG
ncbi:MAG: bifunctional diaminohydroxyphosphoribosylaminopyrimidine deaminase/5-amino-6-(5-phosphoribosylamino)uracil reductase RibD [Candidatus Omnitrophota bacterium]|nr:bifunctional diaminohydroxyphosphoribosylaminopyrimidine deaminase/5-amino-6-(5-phosphoribosylamino)uracil reductase RibD [Candidatus Omnitrophota bacterium]